MRRPRQRSVVSQGPLSRESARSFGRHLQGGDRWWARIWLFQMCPSMSSSQPATANPPTPVGSIAHIIQWLRELEECRKGGLVTDEDYALERAEKLSALLDRHHSLWLATF